MVNNIFTSLSLKEAVGSSKDMILAFALNALAICIICLCPALREPILSLPAKLHLSLLSNLSVSLAISRFFTNPKLLGSLPSMRFCITVNPGTTQIS